jgi:protein-tyrosine phosphatase
MDNGQPVVVHCHAGQQRSAAVMAAYLMWTRKMSLEQSVSYIKLCKPDAFLYGVNFREALEKWAK